ncbi:SH3 domain-containing protein [Hominifimenecus sp. rT4P-3]|uniref:SH3 domain-containing protein n=1 Tax=Hominifimenecus sp. rT4P-3 TaxID=3242979 RepID=UPI003DA5139E
MSKPFDEEDEDFEPLKIDEEFEDVWGGEDDDFVDISLDGGTETEDKPYGTIEASSRPVRKIERVIQDPFAEEEKVESNRYASGRDSRSSYSGSSRGQGGGSRFSGHKSYIILAVICLIVIAAVVVVLKLSSGKSGEGNSEGATSAATEAPTSPWQENGNEAVVQLVNQYYLALKTTDMATLQNIMDAGSLPTEDTVVKMNGYIEDYQNITCYTMAGDQEGEFALYIAYDAKFKDVNTLAPGLTPAYVVTDSAGVLRLMTVEQIQADQRIVTYMNQVSADDKIEQLGKDILNKFNEALAADPALNALVGNGSSTTEAGDTQAPESTDQPEGTSPAESSTPEATTTQAPETTPQETTTAAQGGENTFTEQSTGMVFQNTDTMMYTNNEVKARKAPSTDGDDFSVVAAGTKVHVIGKSDSWYRVYLPDGDGTPRYIRSDLLVLDNPGGGA